MTTGQKDLFEGVKLVEPEPTTPVRLGRKIAQIPLRKKRREAVTRLMEILEELEGKDIYVGSYDTGGRHFWLDKLKLARLKLEWHPSRCVGDQDYLPGVIVLWGNRSACVRIFTDYLLEIREQKYDSALCYLLDFHNGFWESPLDKYRSNYACLEITRFQD